MSGIVGMASSEGGTKRKHVVQEMIWTINHSPASHVIEVSSMVICDFAWTRSVSTAVGGLIELRTGANTCGLLDGEICEYPGAKNRPLGLADYISCATDVLQALDTSWTHTVALAKQLNGIYVLILADLNNRKLTIINDRYGLRPIYYAQTKDGLLFGTEAKALRQALPAETFDDAAVVEFCLLGELLGDKTLFASIRALPPACVLTYMCDNQRLTINRYWKPRYIPAQKQTEDGLVAELVSTFRDAVDIRMRENRRYAVSLSGGLDSRAVVAAVPEDRWSRTALFTFGPARGNESRIAERVAARVGQGLRRIDIPPDMILGNAKDEVYLSDGMDTIGVGYIVPVHKAVSTFAEVVIDGFALDLTLGGSHLSHEVLAAREQDLPRLLYRQMTRVSDLQIRMLFRRRFQKLATERLHGSFLEALAETQQASPADQCDCFLMENHVRRGTAMGHVLMRSVLENTVPTCDYNFLDVVATIPAAKRASHWIYRKFLMKLSPGLAALPYNKTMVRASAPPSCWRTGARIQALREALRRELHCAFPQFSSLSSRSAYVDLDGLLATDRAWKGYFRSLLLGEDSRSSRYFNPDYVREVLAAHGATRVRFGRKNNVSLILNLATIELFLRRFEKP